MIAEVANALLLTYVFSEYILVTNLDGSSRAPNHGTVLLQLVSKRRNLLLSGAVGLINVIERVSGLGLLLHEILEGFLHVPKFLFAVLAYLGALYLDCSRVMPMGFFRQFLPKLAIACCLHLPAYPFLAVLISFGFLFVINLFEFLHLDLQMLNMPIYYGTLYGPLSFLYFAVKKSVVYQQSSLPT